MYLAIKFKTKNFTQFFFFWNFYDFFGGLGYLFGFSFNFFYDFSKTRAIRLTAQIRSIESVEDNLDHSARTSLNEGFFSLFRPRPPLLLNMPPPTLFLASKSIFKSFSISISFQIHLQTLSHPQISSKSKTLKSPKP